MEWVFQQEAVSCNFSNKIFFSDGAHFTIGGHVNEQNCRMWSSENHQEIEEKEYPPPYKRHENKK